MADWPMFNEAYAWTGGAGVLGRLMYHARQVQQGKRKPLSLALMLDLPIALAMGWGAYGAAVWGGLAPEPSISVVIAASYLGPFTIDMLFVRWAEKMFGKEQAA